MFRDLDTELVLDMKVCWHIRLTDFYVVTRIEIPKVLDLNLTVFQFDYNCSHVAHIEKDTKFKVPDMIRDMFKVYCRNIIPYMYLYKHQVEYYEKTVYNIFRKRYRNDIAKVWKY